MRKTSLLAAAAMIAVVVPMSAKAGPVFLTGHDPDFHAQDSGGAETLLKTALSYVTGGTYNTGTRQFLYVESNEVAPGGFRTGTDTLNDIGLVAGINYTQVNAAGLGAVNFSNYSAVVVASDFGALLTSAEIDALIARSADLDAFINAGGGLAAFAECGPGFPNCDSSNVNAATKLFGFVPVSIVSVGTSPPYSVTPFGMTLGLTDADVNDPTHNSFGVVGGLNAVDLDANGVASTLAGNVKVGDGGFTGVPEPLTLSVFGAGLAGAAAMRRRKKAKRV